MRFDFGRRPALVSLRLKASKKIFMVFLKFEQKFKKILRKFKKILKKFKKILRKIEIKIFVNKKLKVKIFRKKCLENL